MNLVFPSTVSLGTNISFLLACAVWSVSGAIATVLAHTRFHRLVSVWLD
jgi:hypothetical protein